MLEILSSKGQSEHFVARKVRWDERQRLKVMELVQRKHKLMGR